MAGGGTWGLKAGQWTDDTSMALCLASSLITKRDYDPYDQMVRYKWWYKSGYLSSTGECFDIGNATKNSLETFSERQNSLRKFCPEHAREVDDLSWQVVQSDGRFDINCSSAGVAGNGALMRLAPVPLFFYRSPELAVDYAGRSARLTHGDQKAVDACRYYAALIVAAVRGESKKELLSEKFYKHHQQWFGSEKLHKDILRIAEGSYQRKKGYKDGIRGTGYVVNTLEAALWTFWSDEESFEKGALAAVNLGDDTDTTAAIYGQLAGAYYGYRQIPQRWVNTLYAHQFLVRIGEWLCYCGSEYKGAGNKQTTTQPVKTLPYEISTPTTAGYPIPTAPLSNSSWSPTYGSHKPTLAERQSYGDELLNDRRPTHRIPANPSIEPSANRAPDYQSPRYGNRADQSRSTQWNDTQQSAYAGISNTPKARTVTRDPLRSTKSDAQSVSNYEANDHQTTTSVYSRAFQNNQQTIHNENSGYESRKQRPLEGRSDAHQLARYRVNDRQPSLGQSSHPHQIEHPTFTTGYHDSLTSVPYLLSRTTAKPSHGANDIPTSYYRAGTFGSGHSSTSGAPASYVNPDSATSLSSTRKPFSSTSKTLPVQFSNRSAYHKFADV